VAAPWRPMGGEFTPSTNRGGWRAAIFAEPCSTNLSRTTCDFHPVDAGLFRGPKALLFAETVCLAGLCGGGTSDDPWGRNWRTLAGSLGERPLGRSSLNAATRAADGGASSVPMGSAAGLHTPLGMARPGSHLVARFNLMNLFAGGGGAASSMACIARLLEAIPHSRPCGRMERVRLA